MSRLPYLTLSLTVFSLTACDPVREAELEPADGGARPWREAPKVGDRMNDGVVSDVDEREGCYTVTVEKQAAWSCSDAQIKAARGGTYTAIDDTPLQADGGAPKLRASDCAGLAALRRPALKSAQRATLDAQRQQLLARCLPTTQVLFFDASGAPRSSSCGRFNGGFADAGVSYSPPQPSSGGKGAEQYSTTNTQVAGVDEADFVKNDSGHVYVLSRTGLHVIDAWPAAETRELTKVAIAGEPTRLFLAGDKLVVYARTAGTGGAPSAAASCTYGYDCRSQAEPGGTVVQVFDVSTPATPRELVRYELSGGYVASRRIGNLVYTVVSDREQKSSPGADLSLRADGPVQLETSYQEKLRQADAIVDGLDAEFFLPWLRVKRGEQTQDVKVGCESGLVARAASGESFTSLISFDLATLGTPQRELVATNAGFVYASAEALYIATDGELGSDRYAYYGASANERSSLHKFKLDGLDTRYVGSALIPGHVLNQFSMDERAGVLRVATSNGWVGTPGVSSNIVSVAEQAGELAVVGQLRGLAPEEDIRSVRFDGERGFVVTFKKTDPLFVIDLVDPAQPRVLGELKIPGFSTYMHPLDRDHLLAIGFDADDHGSFAYFNGIQIQIFDVSELSNPKLQHKTVIGTRGSTSDALTNHLAFNYFAAKGLLALPMTICDGGGNGTYGDKLSFSGLMVFDVSLDKGIVERGRMPFVNAADYASYGCSSWWTQGTSDVKRSIIMDDFVVGISDSLYQVGALSTLPQVLKSIPLGN